MKDPRIRSNCWTNNIHPAPLYFKFKPYTFCQPHNNVDKLSQNLTYVPNNSVQLLLQLPTGTELGKRNLAKM